MKIKSVIISVMFLIMLMGFVSSADLTPHKWEVYGNGFAPSWNIQFSDAEGKFDEGVLSQTMIQGITSGEQVLVSSLNHSEEDIFLILANGNFIQVYDSSFNLVSEKNTIETPQQLAIIDWEGDGFKNDIASVYSVNSSLFSVRIYEFHVVAENLTLTYEQNFTTNSSQSVTGLRRFGDKLYFIYTYDDVGNHYYSNLTIMNSTSLNEIAMPVALSNVSGTPYTEPVAFWFMDSDGDLDFLTFSNRHVVVVDENGNLLYQQNYSGNVVDGDLVLDAKMFSPDCVQSWIQILLGIPCNNDWRIAILVRDRVASFEGTDIEVYKLDGSSVWSAVVVDGSGSTEINAYGQLAVADDFVGDFRDVLYVVGVGDRDVNDDRVYFRIYKGSDGTILATHSLLGGAGGGFGAGIVGSTNFLTLADMNGNNFYDFIFTSGNYIYVYEPVLDTFYINQVDSSYLGSSYCIPADFNNDGLLEIVCSKSGGTKVWLSDYSNQNAFITSVAYDPSTSVQVNTTLYAYVTASDPENQQIFYRHRCDTTLNWTDDSSSNARNCSYASVGTYVLSVAVRDPYHSTYDVFPQTIFVTQTGAICDNDLICEAEQGETYVNCPNDCLTPPNTTTSSAGGLALPTSLVDVTNTQQGLLPEIYYGTLGFMSSVLSPFIILVFVILFVMIIITIGVIVKKISIRVSSLGS